MTGKNAQKLAPAFLTACLTLVFCCLISSYPPPGTLGALYPLKNQAVREARFAAPACNGAQCYLCPYLCFLPEGARGRCRVRANYAGRVRTLVYGAPVSVHRDPIEKKPVYHLYPGSLIYSLAAPGCNLKCKACQNWEISQIWPEEAARRTIVPAALALKTDPSGRVYGELEQKEVSVFSSSDIVACALATRSKAVAYTYSEPAVFYEYMYDTARLAREKGLKNVMVSAGYINRGPLLQLLKYMDVVKIDLKGFSPEFYRDYVGGRLEPVKETLLTLKRSGAFFEVVNLTVPGLNDDPEELGEMVAWIKTNLGPDTPLFFSRFSPNYRLNDLPPTPVETLERARAAAMKAGMKYVYVGNVPGHEGENTYCPKCGRVLVRRYGYAVLENLLSPNGGRCPSDGTKIPGIW